MSTEWKEVQGKWLWKMQYCRNKRIHPGHKWAWDEAENAYYQHILREPSPMATTANPNTSPD